MELIAKYGNLIEASPSTTMQHTVVFNNKVG